MNGNKTHDWNGSDRALLDGLMNEIIPASSDGRIPPGSASGVADFVASKLTGNETAAELFSAGLSSAVDFVNAAGGEFGGLGTDARVDIVKRLEEAEPEFFALLIRYTYMGYYSRSDVRPLFGLSDQPTQPHGYDVPPETTEFMAELTGPVRKRGKVYRAG